MKRILIVDDSEDIRELVLATLKCPEYQILQACNADKAMSFFLNDLPDLIVLDVMMPGKMNGFELCKLIKHNIRLSSIKVILLTARNQRDDIMEGIKVKSDAYVVKPFNPFALQKKVHELLYPPELIQ
ncbi:MAG: response regulator [Methylovulum sp.]|nr:response regulator [Methylovulum sp.]